MPSPHTFLVVAAILLLALAAVGAPGGRFSFVAGGLLAWLLSTLI